MGKSGFYGISGAGNGLIMDRPVRLRKNSGWRFLLQTYVKNMLYHIARRVGFTKPVIFRASHVGTWRTVFLCVRRIHES